MRTSSLPLHPRDGSGDRKAPSTQPRKPGPGAPGERDATCQSREPAAGPIVSPEPGCPGTFLQVSRMWHLGAQPARVSCGWGEAVPQTAHAQPLLSSPGGPSSHQSSSLPRDNYSGWRPVALQSKAEGAVTLILHLMSTGTLHTPPCALTFSHTHVQSSEIKSARQP